MQQKWRGERTTAAKHQQLNTKHQSTYPPRPRSRYIFFLQSKALDVDGLYIVHVQCNRAPKQRRRTYRAHGRINRESTRRRVLPLVGVPPPPPTGRLTTSWLSLAPLFTVLLLDG